MEVFKMKNIILCFCLLLMLGTTNGGRYQYCSDGCCEHQFCAFKAICYPRLNCKQGCPDGSCDNGLCMPDKMCFTNSECKMGHVCTMHFNLGYPTCQYDLDIGRSLCVDRFGRPDVKKYP
ncbi:Hypothetical predicted protein [Mytilus galloprovincialis]|uniref:Uncharacterized protein n=1 Tax=Mytilus galloprovincialis TaxID=29158 RepID=A0A8B6BUU9_MYTGA|nr:Hypothetical predicted protein [Mytilus galloprovincialis]